MRFFLAIALGNALGVGAWALGWSTLPLIWANVDRWAGVQVLVERVALSAMLMAAPPVLIGALSAWLAQRAPVWVGVLSGLWSLGLISTTPKGFPIASPIWFAPTVIIILSSAFGAWMMDLREQATRTA